MTTAGSPSASVIVPAHDESSVIDGCLSTLRAAHDDTPLEVVVVCNGCTDDTADRARRHDDVRVLELAEPSKAAALRAGTAVVTAFPRIVLDADIRLSPGAVGHIVTALSTPRPDGPPPMVATPRAHFDTTGRSWAVRAFFRVHQRLPYLREAPVGPGCFAVSAAGWERLGSFPDLTADDLWVQRHFVRSERTTVEAATFHVETPRSLRFLLRVRTRAYRGMLELDRVVPPPTEPGPPPPGRVRAVLQLAGSPRGLPEVVVYVLVNVVALARARRADRRGGASWERDDSSR